MDIYSTIANIEALTGPSRKADQAIALLAGYTVSVENGANIWRLEGSQQPLRLPTFTDSVDRAIEFSKYVLPGNVGALAWEGYRWRAKINEDGDVYYAPKPALAICLATLGHLRKAS